MDWKYRQVEAGEWDVLEAVGDGRFRGQGEGGKGRVDRGALADARLDMPLPWDHIDTGIEKWWLKADLQRALEATTVPDCSHSGVCTECGVCDDGENFGENVVADVPPLPEFRGAARPETKMAQRLRIRFGKLGAMTYTGHLDTLTVFERACRRAKLPMSSSESRFHARPRISSAMSLPLGASSTGELLEIILTERREPEEVRSALAAVLPSGIPLHHIEEVPIWYDDSEKLTPSMAKLLRTTDVYMHVGPAPSGDAAQDGNGDDSAPVAVDFAATVAAVLAMETCVVSRTNKKGKASETDVRPQLLQLELVPESALPTAAALPTPLPPGTAVLRVSGTAEQDGAGILTMKNTLHLLARGANQQDEEAEEVTFELRHLHRADTTLAPIPPWTPPPPKKTQVEEEEEEEEEGTT